MRTYVRASVRVCMCVTIRGRSRRTGVHMNPDRRETRVHGGVVASPLSKAIADFAILLREEEIGKKEVSRK